MSTIIKCECGKCKKKIVIRSKDAWFVDADNGFSDPIKSAVLGKLINGKDLLLINNHHTFVININQMCDDIIRLVATLDSEGR
jgi:hypothetical protein